MLTFKKQDKDSANHIRRNPFLDCGEVPYIHDASSVLWHPLDDFLYREEFCPGFCLTTGKQKPVVSLKYNLFKASALVGNI